MNSQYDLVDCFSTSFDSSSKANLRRASSRGSGQVGEVSVEYEA